MKNNIKGGGICVCIHNTPFHKILTNCSVSDDDNETVVIEIIIKTTTNITIVFHTDPPMGI